MPQKNKQSTLSYDQEFKRVSFRNKLCSYNKAKIEKLNFSLLNDFEKSSFTNL